jgi:predicted nucleic acid-binding protein
LHELELLNALRLKQFRKEAPLASVRATVARIRDNLHDGILVRPVTDWPAVFAQAADLADRHTASLGSRALDLLHVAAAVRGGARRFVTADARQSTLARRAGLPTTRVR